MLGVDFMFCKKKKNSMVIGTVAGIGVVAAVTAVAFKVRGMVKEKMASEFDDYYCCCDDEDNGENIYIYDEEPYQNRYQDTLVHRRDRVNKRRPSGIRGEKYF